MALLLILKVVGSVVLGYAAWSCISLLLNYMIVRNIGLPIVFSPIYKMNVPWLVACRYTRIQYHLQLLPFGLGRWSRYTFLGWVFDDKYALHKELGPAFVVVSPGGNDVFVADAEATHDVTKRWKDFVKPKEIYKVLEPFGRNLDTVEGDDWSRHRRLTAPSFNEKSSALNWAETLTQAQQMSTIWLQKGSEGTRHTVEDTATLALNVLQAAGYGLYFPFHEDSPEIPPGHSMTYRDAMATILSLYTLYMLIPISSMSSPWMPQFVRTLGHATKEFMMHNEEMLRNERASISKREQGTANLLSALVRASDEAQKTTVGGRSQGLSEEEIFGNLFIYGLAGHETTANVLSYTMCMMAIYPEWQEWVAEEIAFVTKDNPDPKNWKYEEMHLKLKRCLAVMFETLRNYGSVVFIPKETNENPQDLRIAGTTYMIPPKTSVNLNIHAVHVSPKHYSPDPLTWRPSRWIAGHAVAPTAHKDISVPGNESLIDPPAGTFTPWTDGPRICPGKKFAQVEFTAAMAVIFQRMRVEPVVRPGETLEAKKKEVLAMCEDSQLQPNTLQMREPGKVALRWREVGR